MKIRGIISRKSQVMSGVSQQGKQWQKMEIILQTQEQYPKSVCLTAFNQVVNDTMSFNIGELVDANISVESREFNGKWYTDVKLWSLERVQQTMQQPQQPMQQQMPQMPPMPQGYPTAPQQPMQPIQQPMQPQPMQPMQQGYPTAAPQQPMQKSIEDYRYGDDLPF